MPMNYAKTALLLVVLTGILVAMGGLVGGKTGLLIAFGVALVMNALSLWKSDKMVLRMFGAQEVDATSAPGLHSMVAQLARRADLPMPRVYVIQSPQPNAFATGRNPENSAVAASTGLLDTLTKEEISGVMAHELAHIKNRDTLTMAVAATIGGAIAMFAQYMQFSMLFGGGRDRGPLGWVGVLLTVLLAPLAAMMVQMAISRSREYQADRLGAEIAGNPLWLADALRKISNAVPHFPNERAERVPAAAHMFIVNPLTGRGVDNLFSTHPNVQNRIAALEVQAKEAGFSTHTRVDQASSDLHIHPTEDGLSTKTQTVSDGPWARRRLRKRTSVPTISRRRGPWG